MSLLRGCKTKKRYCTEEFASTLAESLSAKRGVKLRPYYCGACKGWHLTKRPTMAEELDAAIVAKKGQIFKIDIASAATQASTIAASAWQHIGEVRRRRASTAEFIANTGFITDVLALARTFGRKKNFNKVRVSLGSNVEIVDWTGPDISPKVVVAPAAHLKFRVDGEKGKRWARAGSVGFKDHLTIDQIVNAPTFIDDMKAIAAEHNLVADMVMLTSGSECRIVGLESGKGQVSANGKST